MKPDYSKSTAGITLDENLVQKYHAKTVEYALALKATYGNKYTDEFYLNYAHRNNVIAMYGATSANYMRNNCPIQDPEWAGYSYEEIIAMENNGYKIPEEVLLWAHSCQESDVTAYQVVSGEAMLDDGSSTEEISGDFSLENLQAKTKQYITKSEKAQKNAEVDMQEFNELAQKAEMIKKEKEDTYKDSMKEISKLSTEWKQLDNKAKNNTLSSSEQKRYNELSSKLGGNNSIVKEIQIEADDLDNLLANMDSLNVDIDNNLILADETIKAGKDLAEIDSNTHELQQKHNFSGIIFKDGGLLEDLLYGAKGTTIQRIAIDTGRDLSEYSSESLTELNTDDNIQLAEFATNYVEEAKKADVYSVENNSQSSENNNSSQANASIDNDTQTGAETNQNQAVTAPATTSQPVQKSRANTSKRRTVSSSSSSSASANQTKESEPTAGKNPNYFVLSGTTLPVLTALATATNLASITDLMIRNGKVEDIQKQLAKDWAKTEKDIQKLQKETAKVEQKHEEYLQRAENALGQLDGVQALKEQEMLTAQEAAMNSQVQTTKSNKTQISDNNLNSQDKQNAQIGNNQQTAQAPNEAPTVTMSPAQAQENALLEQLDYLSAADAKLANKIQKPVAKQKAAVVKNQKTAKVLDVNNEQLIDRTKNNRKVSQATMSSGIATTASGVVNMFLSNQMITLGVKLMMSYWTMPLGVALVAKGVLGHVLATEQLITGPLAIGTATGGLVASSAVSEDSKEYNKSVANSRKFANQNNKLLRDSTNVMNTLGTTIEIPDLSNQQQFQPVKQPMNNNGPELAPNLGKSRTAEVNFTSTKDITNPARTRGNMIADSVLISDPNIKNKKQVNNENKEQPEIKAQKTETSEQAKNNEANVISTKGISTATNNTETPTADITDKKDIKKESINEEEKQETSTKAESAPKISFAIPSISTASVSNDSAFSTGSTTETEKVEQNVKEETTKNTDNSAKAGKENLVAQINNLETKNNGAEKSEKINEILVNNVQKAQMLQQQLGELNNGVQNVAPDSVSDEINPVQGEMDAVAVQIANIINNAQSKMTGSSQETEEDTQDIETQEKNLKAKGVREYDVIEAEQPLTKEDENILAATVSSNAATKTTDSTNTDDKIDRKLSRFNQDSIIESKKKKKKVMAVSASSNKKA